jgi:hypothetical protein
VEHTELLVPRLLVVEVAVRVRLVLLPHPTTMAETVVMVFLLQ